MVIPEQGLNSVLKYLLRTNLYGFCTYSTLVRERSEQSCEGREHNMNHTETLVALPLATEKIRHMTKKKIK